MPGRHAAQTRPRDADAAPDRDSGRGHLQQVARGGFFNLAGSVVSAVVTLGFTVVVTRGLDRPSAGVFFALTSMYTLVFSVTRLGVPTGLVYFVARFRAQGRVERLRPIVIAGTIPVVLLSLAVGAVGVVLAPDLAQWLVHRHDSGTVWLVRLLALFIVWGGLNDLGVGTTRGYGVMRPLVLVDRVGRPVAQLVFMAAVVALGAHHAPALGAAWVLPYLPSALVLWWWAELLRRRTVRRVRARQARAGEDLAELDAEQAVELSTGQVQAATEDAAAREAIEHADDLPAATLRTELKRFWRFTIPRTIGSIAQMVLQRADVVLIGILRGPAQAAVYAAATRFLVFGQLGGGAISTTIQPKISALIAKRDIGGARLVYRTATVWLILLTWPIYLLFSVFSTDMLRLFGGSYTVGAPVIIILSLAMLVATACGAVDVVLVMAGRSTWTMTNAIVALAVNLALNLLLIPKMGINGAAIAWAVAILINNLAPLTELAVWMRLHPFGRPTVLATASAALCFGAIPLLSRLVLGRSLAWELVAAAVGAAVYLGLLWRWRDPLELKALLAIRRRKGVAAAAD